MFSETFPRGAAPEVWRVRALRSPSLHSGRDACSTPASSVRAPPHPIRDRLASATTVWVATPIQYRMLRYSIAQRDVRCVAEVGAVAGPANLHSMHVGYRERAWRVDAQGNLRPSRKEDTNKSARTCRR